jgi:hypothetical protein
MECPRIDLLESPDGYACRVDFAFDDTPRSRRQTEAFIGRRRHDEHPAEVVR